MKNRALIAGVVAFALCAGLAPSAHAWGKHSHSVHLKVKKNNGPFGISLKAKKQKKPKGYYRETLTGRRVY